MNLCLVGSGRHLVSIWSDLVGTGDRSGRPLSGRICQASGRLLVDIWYDLVGSGLVGAKYVGSICAGLASALPVVSGVLMSIPRNLVCWGEMDPGSTPPSVVTSVAGAP